MKSLKMEINEVAHSLLVKGSWIFHRECAS